MIQLRLYQTELVTRILNIQRTFRIYAKNKILHIVLLDTHMCMRYDMLYQRSLQQYFLLARTTKRSKAGNARLVVIVVHVANVP